MNRMVVFFFTVFLMLNIASGIRAEETTAQFGRFGKITVYRPSLHPAHVVLFVSGDGGWNLGVVDMARELGDPQEREEWMSSIFRRWGESDTGPPLEAMRGISDQGMAKKAMEGFLLLFLLS